MAACSDPSAHGGARQVAEAAAVPPEPPEQSAEEQKITDSAHLAYVACLNRAARYADDHLQSMSNVAGVIAPMCYAQFEEFEAATQAGLSRRDTRLQIRRGDQQQVELAEQAVKQERSQAALATTK